jgi:transposase-like protein
MNIIEIFNKFKTQEQCIAYLAQARWHGKPICVYCGSDKVSIHKEKKQSSRLQCSSCKRSFSVTMGTIFHDSRLPLQKWFIAIALILNAKKGISSRQLARDLDVHVETAWSMAHRIRKAMTQEDGLLLKGIVEMDETYIGGKPRKEAKSKDDDDSDNITHNKRGRGTKKQAVVGMIERKGSVKAQLASNNKLSFRILSDLVRKNVDTKQAVLYTDEFKAYSRMETVIEHKQIDHSAGVYSINGISTNCMESFWAIVKRGIIGQFHKVSKKYLDKYLDEFCWRFNNRKNEFAFDCLVFNCVFNNIKS